MKLSVHKPGRQSTEGPVVVFLHAYPLNSGMWHAQLEGLADICNPIALDFRGYGASADHDESLFSFNLYAEDVIETVRELGLEKAVFAGCSMGGYAMFALWRQAPELVQALILCDTRAEADKHQTLGKRADQMQAIRQKGPAFMQSFVAQNLLSKNTLENKPDLVHQVKDMVAATSAGTMVRTLQMLAGREDSGPTLPTITVPTLVMVGEHDQVTPLEAHQRLAREIPGAQLFVVPDAGHLSPFENPEVVNQEIAVFLKGLPA